MTTRMQYLKLHALVHCLWPFLPISGRVKKATSNALILPISGRVDRASATEAVDTGSIPGRVKPKTMKIGIHSFPA